MLQNILKSNHFHIGIDSTLDEDEVIHAKELEEALRRWSEECSIISLSLHVNFQFGWQTGCQGYTASMLNNAPFNADICRSDKFRVIASAKLVELPDDFLLDETFEMKMRNCFPIMPSNDNLSKNVLSRSPSLENRGCSIGITYIEKHLKDTGRISRDYYITVHTCLPAPVLNEILHEDYKISRRNIDTMEKIRDPNNHLQVEEEIVTYEKAFEEGYNAVALKLARENARKLIVVFADLFKLKLENPATETNLKYELETTEVVDLNLLEKTCAIILSKWPVGAPIYPFTIVNQNQTLLPAAAVKENAVLLGYFLQQLKKADTAKFTLLMQKQQITYIDTVKTCDPEIMTEYNTFRSDSLGNFTWYSNTTPIEGSLMMYQGPILGYCVYNFQDGLVHDEEWRNDMLNSFPVLFTSKISNDKSFEADVLTKNFSLKKGGMTLRSPIEQLSRVFCNLDKMDHPQTIEELNLSSTVHQRMIPKKIFYSMNGFQNHRFEQQETE